MARRNPKFGLTRRGIRPQAPSARLVGWTRSKVGGLKLGQGQRRDVGQRGRNRKPKVREADWRIHRLAGFV